MEKGKGKKIALDPESQVLILSPDRSGLREGLISENEGSLNGLKIDGELAGLLDRVEIKWVVKGITGEILIRYTDISGICVDTYPRQLIFVISL